MMSTVCWASHGANSLLPTHNCLNRKKPPKFETRRIPQKSSYLTCALNVGFQDIAEIVRNKVLIAAGVSAAIGQLSKPFTSVLLYRKDFDIRAAFRAGRFPSTHSSTVVAAATSLALERGFSDSIFGLTLVYAGLVMYDAQGVRREVGNHAKVLNELLSNTQVNSGKERSLGTLSSKESRPFLSGKTDVLSGGIDGVKLNSQIVIPAALESEGEEGLERYYYDTNSVAPLKESIGHTEVEVVAGALLGFFVSLAVNTVM